MKISRKDDGGCGGGDKDSSSFFDPPVLRYGDDPFTFGDTLSNG